LWEMPASLLLPGNSRWLPGGGRSWTARQQIDRAIRQRSVAHFVIDAPALATAGAAAFTALERVLRHAYRRNQAGQLEVRHLGTLAALLSPARRTAASKSILRTAG